MANFAPAAGSMAVVDAELAAQLLAVCSNAGRWGPDDELGTLNLITPETRRRAARLVTEGVSMSIASDLSLHHTPSTDSLERHTAYTEPGAEIAVADTVVLKAHGWSTHMDALGHVYNEGVGYNGRRKDDVFDDTGLARNAITAIRDGVFARGVLLDVAAACGRPWLPAEHTVSRAELERAEDAAGLHVDAGDAVFVHTGLSARLAATDGADPDRRAGLDVDAVVWLHEHDVAVFSGDCVEVLPGPDPAFPLPLHQLGVAGMGLVMLEWTSLDRLLDACRQFARYEFLLTVAPLPIVGGTGSPVNPIVTF